jgi:hypothetical protein
MTEDVWRDWGYLYWRAVEGERLDAMRYIDRTRCRYCATCVQHPNGIYDCPCPLDPGTGLDCAGEYYCDYVHWARTGKNRQAAIKAAAIIAEITGADI